MARIFDFRFRKVENKNRSSLEIVRDVLSVATQRCKKTQILYDAHLNYRLLEKYLSNLLENCLLDQVDDSYYLITSKGKNFLQNYEEHIERCRKIDKDIRHVLKEKMALKNMYFNNGQKSEKDKEKSSGVDV